MAPPQFPDLGRSLAESNGKMMSSKTSLSSIARFRSPSIMSKAASTETRALESNRDSHGSSHTLSSTNPSPDSPLTSSFEATDASSRRPKKLRSQYGRDAGGNHVEYILVASFDVDRGPMMENQHPGAIKGDQHMLAELMLPDQAHVRHQDWTIFFLHKDTSGERNEDMGGRRPRQRARSGRLRTGDGAVDHDAVDDHDDDDDDDYDDAHADLDEGDATADDDMELTGSEAESESDDAEADQEEDQEGGPPLVYVLNLVNTKRDTSAERYSSLKMSSSMIRDVVCPADIQKLFFDRGAVVKAMAICTRHSFLHIYKVGQRTIKPFPPPPVRLTLGATKVESIRLTPS